MANRPTRDHGLRQRLARHHRRQPAAPARGAVVALGEGGVAELRCRLPG